MKVRIPIGLGSIGALLLVAPFVVAQTTGTIEGTVTDQNGGALPGVTVEVTSPNLQGTRDRDDGQRRAIPFRESVPRGPTRSTASLSGMGTVAKTANVTLDATATVNMQMRSPPRRPSWSRARRRWWTRPRRRRGPTTRPRSSTSCRSAATTPRSCSRSRASRRTTARRRAGRWRSRCTARPRPRTTSSIDGVNTTNVIKGFQGKYINTEFIQEVEVKTGGYQAEYGRNTGGVINVITKSGGNEFHGDVFGYYNNRAPLGDQKPRPRPRTLPDGTTSTTARSSDKDRRGVRRRPRRLLPQGPDLVLRRLRPRDQARRTSRSTGARADEVSDRNFTADTSPAS